MQAEQSSCRLEEESLEGREATGAEVPEQAEQAERATKTWPISTAMQEKPGQAVEARAASLI
jgi:hypothetical protein